ncbi:MAG: energy transducer TonB [Methylococcales bacterium]
MTLFQNENRVRMMFLCTMLVAALHLKTVLWLTHPDLKTPVPTPLPVEVTLLPPIPIEQPKIEPVEQPKPVIKPKEKPLPAKPKAIVKPKPAPIQKPKPIAENKPVLKPAPVAVAPVITTPVAPTAQPTFTAPVASPAPVSHTSTAKSTSAPANASSSESDQGGNYPVKSTYSPQPPYPQSAKNRGWEGTVTVLIKISAAGLVEDVTVSKSSGYDMLDDAVLETVKTYKFIPARRGNTTVAATAKKTISFKLQD